MKFWKEKGGFVLQAVMGVFVLGLVNNSHGVGLGGVLLALGGSLLSLAAAIDESISVLVGVELGDDNVGRVDSNLNSLSIDLLARDLLDVDDVLGAGDQSDLSFLGLMGSVTDQDLVVLADGGRTDTELLAQVR